MSNGTTDGSPSLTLVEREACAENLARFIDEAKALAVFGADLDWDHWHWKGVGTFTVQWAVTKRPPKTIAPSLLLPPGFIDFAKAFIRYQEGENLSRDNLKKELAALRLVELALSEEGGGGDPTRISLHTLDRAAQLARENYKQYGAYDIGQNLVKLAKLLQRKILTRNAVGSFSNPNSVPNPMRIMLGEEADRHRQAKLPDERAMKCIGSVFSDIDAPEHPDNVQDVFATSVVTILMAGSKRGGEVFEMTKDCLQSEFDSEGIERWAFRWRSFKNRKAPSRPSWIHEAMVPYAREAFRRLHTITEEPRRFARYCEQQLALRATHPGHPGLRFYRHTGCPDVPDDRPLTKRQVLDALGSKQADNTWNALKDRGLTSSDGAYTLESLWSWVLDRLPDGFPYVKGAKNKRLKYSEALFCMHPNQLATGACRTTNPVGVWLPSLGVLTNYLHGTKKVTSFFERHRAEDEDGNPLRLGSHSIRHLLDTMQHEGSGESYLGRSFINAMAGREKAWQGNTYDHSSAEEKAEIVRAATQQADGRSALFDLPALAGTGTEIQTSHWSVRLKPRSTADLEIHERSATIATIWGGCEHDWLLKPCPYNRECLNCASHVCIKGLGKDDQERLQRLKKLLDKIVRQQQLAKDSLDKGYPGAKHWFAYQTLYRERVEELIGLLESPELAEGAEIRLTGNANTHLHRVLRQKVLHAVENQMGERDAVDYLVAAYRENLALPLDFPAPLMENRDGA